MLEWENKLKGSSPLPFRRATCRQRDFPKEQGGGCLARLLLKIKTWGVVQSRSQLWGCGAVVGMLAPRCVWGDAKWGRAQPAAVAWAGEGLGQILPLGEAEEAASQASPSAL